MRERPSSRLLVVDSTARLLLFAFAVGDKRFWATPGGATDPGESFPAAAARELREETGIVADPGPEVARRDAVFETADGTTVQADERYFLVRTDTPEIVEEGWTELEKHVIEAHRWWSADELRATEAVVWPNDIVQIMIDVGAWPDVADAV